MQIISEYKIGNDVHYTVSHYNDKLKKPIFKEDISYKSVIRENNSHTYLLIYDTNMNLVHDAFVYLNFYISSNSTNSRISDMNALKFLFCFESIIGKKLAHFNKLDVIAFKAFLQGISKGGNNLVYNLITIRSNATINGYLSIYRKYCDFIAPGSTICNYLNSIRGEIHGYQNPVLPSKINTPYVVNVKVPCMPCEVPYYISVQQFKDIIIYCRTRSLLEEECIIRLMYQCGLRIGEILGLTSDDMLVEKVNNTFVPVAKIRNRFSDKVFQNAKGCMNVSSRDAYNLKEYGVKGYGWQEVYVPEDLYDLINEYIESSHPKAIKEKTSNYQKHTIADRVSKGELWDNDNYYIFINTQGRPMSQKLWNDRLRIIFENCGILLDSNHREHNLNHRFRHGFAMYQVKYRNIKQLELAALMRHANPASTFIYFKPTQSDIIEIKTDFAQSLYEIIPQLRGYSYVETN